MWIREAVLDPPPGSRTALGLCWLRTLALACAALAIGSVVDAVLRGASPVVPMVAAAVAVPVAALAGAGSEARVGRMHADTETRFRRLVVSTALARTVPTDADATVLDAATDGVARVAGYRAEFLTPTLAAFTSPVIVLASWAVGIGPGSALVLLAFVALVPPFIVLGDTLLRRSNRAYRVQQSKASSGYLELVEGLGTITVLDAAPRVLEDYARSARSAMRELTRLLARNQLVIIAHDLVFGVLMRCTAVALLLLGLAQGRLTLGAAVAGILLTVLLLEPMHRVGRTFSVARGGRARRDQIEAMVADGPAADAGPADAATARKVSSSPEPDTIRLDGIRVTRGDTEILHGIDLEIPAGSHVALIGPSGAGKTTLLRLLSGLEEPSAGTITEGGRAMTSTERRSRTRTLSQHVDLLSTSVADNLRLVAPEAEAEQLREVLRTAGLLAEVESMPRGLANPVGEGGAFLSGGQRRRLGLARMLLGTGPVVLLDEPTADLDRETETVVREQIDRALQGCTVVETSHRLSTTLSADLVVVIEDGRVCSVGPPALLRTQSGFYADGLGTETEGALR
jgi:ABC-type transport system involved in cytochrome bd biosynthesis fused ATPase/permease subunit